MYNILKRKRRSVLNSYLLIPLADSPNRVNNRDANKWDAKERKTRKCNNNTLRTLSRDTCNKPNYQNLIVQNPLGCTMQTLQIIINVFRQSIEIDLLDYNLSVIIPTDDSSIAITTVLAHFVGLVWRDTSKIEFQIEKQQDEQVTDAPIVTGIFTD
ncbi:MAG: hypothetical protein EZS28_009032 [Streblomastix strix]|uniref:Uncharacterized protein n=1 Tax=Streblomastix strix TaxID=222440 RepID=A0A5J4WLL0_9EUKA|nr:MAG: hypothetical protein EZS28_009032 [Streblomastix strix]